MAKLREKVAPAYSGSLGTTAIIPWLREHPNYEVIYCCADYGQNNELSGPEECAKFTGASEPYLLDGDDSFVDDYILPCLQAGPDTEWTALLDNALSRPLMAQKLVELARKEHAVAICHGMTGKSNDQVRFELSVKALAPELKVIALWRMAELRPPRSCEDELAYCRQKGIDLPSDANHAYSHDKNLWHSSYEGLELEDPAQEPMSEELLRLGASPEQVPDAETLLHIDFEEGVPVNLDGKRTKFSDLPRRLDEIGGKNGIGILDIVEDRVVDMKARGVYEIPGIATLLEVKQGLEVLTLNGDTLVARCPLGEKYVSLFYAGKWFISLREALQVFFTNTQNTVSGEVRLRLYKDNLIHAGAGSIFSLYAEDVVPFTTGSLYHHHDADDSIALFGLPFKLRARMLQRAGVVEGESALIGLPTLPLPVKTAVNRVKRADKKQTVGRVTKEKESDEKIPGKKKAVKRETAKKTAGEKGRCQKSDARGLGKNLRKEVSISEDKTAAIRFGGPLLFLYFTQLKHN